MLRIHRSGLLLKAIAAILAVLVCIMLITGYVLIKQQKRHFSGMRKQRTNIAVSMVKIAARSAVNDMATYEFVDNYNLDKPIADIKNSYKDILYVIFLDNEGKVIAQSEKNSNGKGTEEIRKQDMVEVSSPVMFGDRKLGTVKIGFSLESMNKELAGTILHIVILLTGGIIALSVLISLCLQRIVINPIVELAHAASRLEQGDMTAQVRLRATGEVQTLIDNFNTMAKNLKMTTVSKAYVDNIIRFMFDSLIVISPDMIIKNVNRATCELLGCKEEELIEKPVETIFVTAEKEIEEILNEIKEGAFILTKDYKIIHANNALKKMVKLEEKDIINQYCYKITHNRDEICQPPYDVCPISEVNKKNRPCVELHTHLDSEGKEIMVHVLASPVRDNSGNIVYYLHLTKDIKKHEDRGTLLRKDMDSVKQLIHKIETVVNKLEKEKIIGRKDLKTLSNRGTVSNQEVWYKAKDGRSIPTLFSSSVMKDKNGNITNIICVAKDITERKEIEKALTRSNAELEQFAYIASHELKEPLRKVSVFGDRLKVKYFDLIGEQGQDYLNRMTDASQRMQKLIDGLLEYSRVTTQAQPFIPVDLSKVVREVLSDLEIRIEQTGANVKSGDMPTIDADPLQMHQLLQNLISNALKFHKQDETTVVKISSIFVNDKGEKLNSISDNGTLCQISVEDNGIGFDEKYTDQIFGVFQRLHGRSEYEGTGIGLSVCKKIVERHGGTITAKSAKGQGATFVITLPVK